jgi:predicted O-linked N-acetylglucosamine transferase (SPINDLY family)
MLRSLYRHLRRPAVAVAETRTELDLLGALLRSGNVAAALSRLDELAARHPEDAYCLHLLGVARLQAGNPGAAVRALSLAIELAPDEPVFRANLGLALWRSGDLHGARMHLEAAVDAQPGMASAALNLANVLIEMGYPGSAQSRLTAVIESGAVTDAAEAAQLWVALAGLEPLVPGIDGRLCLQRARSLAPDAPWLPLLGYMSFANRCDWSYPVAQLCDYLESHVCSDPPAGSPVFAPAIADCVPVTPAARAAVARRYARMVTARIALFDRELPARPLPAPDGRIRLGYLSADFHNHPTMHLLMGVLAAHDRDRFELHAYSYGPDDSTGVRQAAVACFDRFTDVVGEAPLATARRIAADGIDVLVDLKGFTGSARPEIVALRPAPVQVNFLGYPGSMGAAFADYLIADAVLVPDQARHFHGECVVRMPHSYQPTDNTQAPVEPPPHSLRQAAGLPADAPVFCSFNSCYKIDAVMFDLWMAILREVPQAVMWILADRTDARENLLREASRRGVDAQRIVFANSLPRAQHLARMALGDLFLDTRLVTAHTTASDALWAGLPLLTLKGDGFASRVAASVLAAAGLGELVCDDMARYRALAVALARDRDRLRGLRQRCRAARTASAVFDTRGYTRSLEAAYAEMHRRRLAALPPAAFDVARLSEGAAC